MGLFDFIKNVGKKLGGGPSAEDIKKTLQKSLGDDARNIRVDYNDGTVQLAGSVPTEHDRQKAILIAGNVEGVERVNDDFLSVDQKEEEVAEEAIPASNYTFYTIQSGDSLSKIAKRYYGDASKWPTLFEANREVIEDPDLIYPGQQIRVPANADA